ncbi:unnamed protein product [Amoebophrya sp. A120]|nr:unnamed protein product [Amoebophrya sp. A120]|eukprot:GSA120T00019885001.1
MLRKSQQIFIAIFFFNNAKSFFTILSSSSSLFLFRSKLLLAVSKSKEFRSKSQKMLRRSTSCEKKLQVSLSNTNKSSTSYWCELRSLIKIRIPKISESKGLIRRCELLVI